MSTNTFIDEDGDVFSARLDDQWAEEADHTIELSVKPAGKDAEALTIEFYKYDAARIIALIAETAKPTIDPDKLFESLQPRVPLPATEWGTDYWGEILSEPSEDHARNLAKWGVANVYLRSPMGQWVKDEPTEDMGQ